MITRALVRPTRSLTAIRGLDAWWVVVFHFREALPLSVPPAILWFAEYGYLAVDLFFLLSGYVIALNYAQTLNEARPGTVIHFLLLRLSRIYPLHIFMLLLFLINPLAILVFSEQADLGERYNVAYFLRSIFLVQNWGIDAGTAWNIPAWSISTEWFAYLVFPAAALYLLRIIGRITVALITIAATLTVLALTAHALRLDNIGADITGFGLLRCCLEFFCGTLLWRLQSLRAGGTSSAGNRACLAAACCFLLQAAFGWPDYIMAPLGFALMLWGLLDENALLSRLLSVRALEAVGLVSYSTYLCHYFVKDWVNFLLVRPGVPDSIPFPAYLVIIGIMSVILYRTIELPGRKLGRAYADQWLRLMSGRRQSP